MGNFITSNTHTLDKLLQTKFNEFCSRDSCNTVEHAISTGIATSNCKIKAVCLQISSCSPSSQQWQCYIKMIFVWVSELNQLNSHLTGTQLSQVKENSRIARPGAKNGSKTSPACNTELLAQLLLALQCCSQAVQLSHWLEARVLQVTSVPSAPVWTGKQCCTHHMLWPHF